MKGREMNLGLVDSGTGGLLHNKQTYLGRMNVLVSPKNFVNFFFLNPVTFLFEKRLLSVLKIFGI